MHLLYMDYDYIFKILLIGDINAGKSSILLRYADDRFSEMYISTIGVDFRIKTVTVDGKIIKLQIWDTAGQERFRTITSSYYRGAHGIMICYDVTDSDSFKNVQMWLKEIEAECAFPPVAIEAVGRYKPGSGMIRQWAPVSKLIVGNKCDLSERRAVLTSVAEEFCRNRGVRHMETSAKDGTNISEAFAELAGLIKAGFSKGGPAYNASGKEYLSLEDGRHRHRDKSCCPL